MDRIQLHFYQGCPKSRLVVAALIERGIEYTSSPVQFGQGNTATEPVKSLCEEGSIPCLVHNGHTIKDYFEILRYIDQQPGGDSLQVNDASEQQIKEIQSLEDAINNLLQYRLVRDASGEDDDQNDYKNLVDSLKVELAVIDKKLEDKVVVPIVELAYGCWLMYIKWVSPTLFIEQQLSNIQKFLLKVERGDRFTNSRSTTSKCPIQIIKHVPEDMEA